MSLPDFGLFINKACRDSKAQDDASIRCECALHDGAAIWQQIVMQTTKPNGWFAGNMFNDAVAAYQKADGFHQRFRKIYLPPGQRRALATSMTGTGCLFRVTNIDDPADTTATELN